MKRMNLQFFAEGEEPTSAGAEESVNTAEQTETVGDEVEVTENEPQVDEPQEQTRDFDRDAIYADARRKAEAEAKKRQADMDAEFARRFGGYKNPITGEPIRSQADYLAALDAQAQAKVEEQIKASGVDTNILQEFIDNNPVVRQAKEYMERIQLEEAKRQIDADVAELTKLNPSIKTFDNVPQDVIEYATNKKVSLTDAYKVLNYGKVTEQNVEAARQSAVNQIKNKQHMAPMNGVASNNTELEIPSNELSTWKALFPEKTYDQLRTLYNNAL